MRLAVLFAAAFLLLSAAPVLAEAEEVEHYDSLEAMTAGADAAVLGRIVEVVTTRMIDGSCGTAEATLTVEQVLAGHVPFPETTIRLETFFCGDAPAIGAGLPAQRGIFFLRNQGEDLRKWHPDATEAEIAARRPFWRLVISAGSIVDAGGSTHVPETYNAEWLAPLEGTPFDDVVAAVRAAAPADSQPAAESGEWALPVGAAFLGGIGALAALAIVAGRQRRRAAP